MDNLALRPITMNFISAALTLPSTSVYSTGTSTNGVINGKFTTVLTAQTTQATPTTDASTGAAFIGLTPNQTCALVFGITAAGAIAMAQGPAIATITGVTTTVGAFDKAPQFPVLPDNFLPLAYVLVRTAPSAATWTPGTSSWTASGVTTGTVVNVSTLPSRPQIA